MSPSARRALLFIPGDSRRKIEKGAVSGVDSVIMDLEDGVALNAKEAARREIAAALHEVHFGRTERLVRVNPAQSPWFDADLDAVLDAHPDGIVVPKVESVDHIAAADARIWAAETDSGWTPEGIPLIVFVETALGVVNLREIAGSARQFPRLSGIAFGAEDLAGDIGATRTREGAEIACARSAVVLHAKAFGLQAFDMVHIHLDDEDALIAESRAAAMMGFTGKQAIHPRQIAPIQAAFTPTDAEIAAARALLAANDAHQAAGTGAFLYEGRMIDMPMIRAARHVLARAEAAGR